MTPLLFTEYLEAIARYYMPMLHSEQNKRFTTRELFYFGSAGSTLKLNAGPCLVALEPRYNGIGDISDNNVNRMAFAFVVVQHYPKNMKAEEIVVLDNALFLHAMKIIGKIKHDQQQSDANLLFLKPQQARVFKAPAYFDDARGWEVQIPLDFDASELMAYNNSDWD